MGFGEPQAAGELRAVRMRHLVADVHGEMTPPLIPNRAAAARLDWRVGLAVLAERRLDNDAGVGKKTTGIAGRETLVRDQIVGEPVINQRRAGFDS